MLFTSLATLVNMSSARPLSKLDIVCCGAANAARERTSKQVEVMMNLAGAQFMSFTL